MFRVLRKLHYLFLIGFVLSMPFNYSHIKINSFCIILLTANSLLFIFFRKEPFEKNKLFLATAFALMFAVPVLFLFNTDNFSQGVFDVQKKLSLLLFPIIMVLAPPLTAKETRTIALSFVTACVCIALYCLGLASWQWLLQGNATFFFRHDLSMLVGMHATYLSLYYCFSIVLLVFLYQDFLQVSLKKKLTLGLAFAVLLLSILLLGGRMQIFVLLVGMLIYFAVNLKKSGNKLNTILKAFGLIALVLGLTFVFPNNREKFKEAFNYNIGNRWGEQQIRGSIWDCSFQLIKAYPLTGVGTGDVQDELQKCYVDNEYTSLTYWENVRFNAHNQFLEVTIAGGLIALLLFTASLSVSLIYAVKSNKKLYLLFIVVFAVSCLTESLLERQSGIAFWGFFNALLCFNSTEDESQSSVDDTQSRLFSA
jgi:O-antigen ligase